MDDPVRVAVVGDYRRELICNAEPSLRAGAERRAIRLPSKAALTFATAGSSKGKSISSAIGVGAC
jgi:hypothetical protein